MHKKRIQFTHSNKQAKTLQVERYVTSRRTMQQAKLEKVSRLLRSYWKRDRIKAYKQGAENEQTYESLQNSSAACLRIWIHLLAQRRRRYTKSLPLQKLWRGVCMGVLRTELQFSYCNWSKWLHCLQTLSYRLNLIERTSWSISRLAHKPVTLPRVTKK